MKKLSSSSHEFIEVVDFTSFLKKEKAENIWITTIEYALTPNTAKEISKEYLIYFL